MPVQLDWHNFPNYGVRSSPVMYGNHMDAVKLLVKTKINLFCLCRTLSMP